MEKKKKSGGVSLVAQWFKKKKNLPANAGNVGREDPLEKEMATYSTILAWKTPWTEEPGGLQPVGSQKNQTQLSD